MATAGGPKIVTDGLVFGYDTNYGVADNVTGTRFYTGESTINLIPSSAATGTGNFARQSYHNEVFTYSNVTNYRERANVHRLYINPSGNTAAPYADYGGQYYKSGGSAVGDVYAISFDFYVAKGNNSPSLSTTYANGYKSPTNAGAASITANSDVDLGDGWTRRTRIATITIAGNTHWRFGLNTGGNETEAYLDNVQIELKSHATPFIDGTRSSTASLIDLKETTDISMSNVSFDSTGQPEMDGSSDYIDLGADLAVSPINQGWTAEYVFNSDSAEVLQHFNGCEEDVHNAGWLALYENKLQVWDRAAGVWKYGSTVFASNTWYHIAFVQVDGTTMQFYVNGVAEGGNHVSFAWTAAKSAFFARYVGKYEYAGYSRYFNGHIPVARFYDKGLSAAEIKQNYNTLKNRFDI